MEELLSIEEDPKEEKDFQSLMNNQSQSFSISRSINSNSFGKEFRIQIKKDFDYIYNKGNKLYGKYYIAFYINSKINQLGISIPKKMGNSVFRNRQKRILREFFRVKKNYIDQPINIIFVLKKIPPDAISQQIDIKRVFQCLMNIEKHFEK